MIRFKARIVSDWVVKNGRFILHVIVPTNTTAIICVPKADVKEVNEGNRPIIQADGVTGPAQAAECAKFEVGLGDYTFATPMKLATSP